jgi:cbb3-type cytochrome oxidase subunit 3
MINIQLGNSISFGWVIIAFALITTLGIYIAYRKQQVIKIKYVIAVLIMFFIGIKWVFEH